MPNQNIKVYTHQRVVRINKAICDKSHLYTTNNLQALDNAMSVLSTMGGAKLWIYLAKNQNRHLRALSSKDFCQWANCSIKAYNNGFKELVDNGFLIPIEEDEGSYEFNDWGKINITANNEKEEQEVIADDGKFHF